MRFFLVKMHKIACVIRFNSYIAPPKILLAYLKYGYEKSCSIQGFVSFGFNNSLY